MGRIELPDRDRLSPSGGRPVTIPGIRAFHRNRASGGSADPTRVPKPLSPLPRPRHPLLLSRRRVRAFVALLVAAGLTGARPGRPDVVNGTVVRDGTNQPLAGALVTAMDGAGTPLGRTVTGPDGAFSIDVASVGVAVSFQVDAIGLRPWRTGPLAERPGGHRLVMPDRPIRLAGLPDAPGAEACVVRPGAETAAGITWAEVRKALQVEAWARSANRFLYDVFQYERRLSSGERIETERSRRLDGMTGSPARSRPAAELAEQGYARTTTRGEVLYAPDVDALLSDEFAAGHCFRVVREGQGSGALVGLAFAPPAGREAVDIEGVFWLNPATGQLISLEFGYTGLEDAGSVRLAGGGLSFARLPDGLWTVARSWVRTPVPGGSDQFREEGVEVLRVVDADGADYPVIGRAGLVGTVRVRPGGPSAEGANVELLGTDYTAVANADGRFFIPELPPGRYRIAFSLTAGAAGRGAPRDVWLAPGQTTLVDLEPGPPTGRPIVAAQAPSAADSIRFYLRSLGIVTTQRVDSLIHAALEAKEEGRLLGRVVDQSTGRPIPGAFLSIPANERTAVTEADGTFTLGDMPAGRYVMTSRMLGYGERSDTIEVREGLVIEATVALATRAIELAPISVTVRSRWLDQHGFYERRTAGLAGHFFTREDIQKKTLTEFTDLLRDVPGVSLVHAQVGMTSIRFRRLHRVTATETEAVRGCEPGVYYDGIPMNSSIDRLDMIAVPFVEGVEVYVGAATPIEYQHPCGVILVWTRRPR